MYMAKIKLIHHFYLRYSWFKNWPSCSSDWPDSRISKLDWPRAFCKRQTKNCQSPFIFFPSKTAFKNHADWAISSYDIAELRTLKSDWSSFDHAQLKIYAILYDSWIYIIIPKIKLNYQFFLIHSWFKNPATSLAESIFVYNSRTRIFPYVRFVQAQS